MSIYFSTEASPTAMGHDSLLMFSRVELEMSMTETALLGTLMNVMNITPLRSWPLLCVPIHTGLLVSLSCSDFFRKLALTHPRESLVPKQYIVPICCIVEPPNHSRAHMHEVSVLSKNE